LRGVPVRAHYHTSRCVFVFVKMNDRMPKLQELRKRSGKAKGNPFADHTADIETGPLTPSGNQTHSNVAAPEAEGFEEAQLEEFYGLISQVKLNTYKLKQSTKKVKQIGESFMESLQDPDLKERKEKELQSEKESAAVLTAGTGALFSKLQKLEEHNDYGSNPKDPDGLTAGYRMILTASAGARGNWKEAMRAYIDAEKKIASEQRERYRRHLEIAEGTTPSEERLDAVEDEAPDVFAQAMMGKADLALARSVNDHAHAREEEVNLILHNQREIFELWSQLGILTNQQGETLNNIYQNLEMSKEYVKEANEQLKVVPAMQNNSRKCYCFIILGLLLILCIVAVPVYLAQNDSSAR